MVIYKITAYRTHPESSISSYEDVKTPKEAYEIGKKIAEDVFGSFDPETMLIKVKQDRPV